MLKKIMSLTAVCLFASTPALADSIYEPGDANLDGNVNILDVVKSVRIIMDTTATPPPAEALVNADLNCDGSINVQDLIISVDIVLGQESQSQQETVAACFEDADNDGFPHTVDCDDDDPDVNPDADEVRGNYVDDDCDVNTTDPTLSACAPQRAFIDQNSLLTVTTVTDDFWKWDGMECTMFSGPACAGEDCDDTFGSEEACQAQYDQCLPCSGYQCGLNGDEACTCGSRCFPPNDMTMTIKVCHADGLCRAGTPGSIDPVSGEYENPPCAEPYTGSCGPQDASQPGSTLNESTMFRWDGAFCVPMQSGTCVGDDCDNLYPDDENDPTRSTACELAHLNPEAGFCQAPCDTAKDCAIMNINRFPLGGVDPGFCSNPADMQIKRDLGLCFGLSSPGFFTCEANPNFGMERICVQNNGLAADAAVVCGDGKCDIPNGETPQSCHADCLPGSCSDDGNAYVGQTCVDLGHEWTGDPCGAQLMWHTGMKGSTDPADGNCLPFHGYYWDGVTCEGNMLSGCLRGGPDFGMQFPSVDDCNAAHGADNVNAGLCTCGHEILYSDVNTGEGVSAQNDCSMSGGHWDWGSCTCKYSSPSEPVTVLSVNTFCLDDLQPPPEGYETESGGVFAERVGDRISIRTVLLNVNREIAENTHDPGNEFTVRIGENPDGDELIFNVSANEDLDWPPPGSMSRSGCDVELNFSYGSDTDASVEWVTGYMLNLVDFYDGVDGNIEPLLPPDGFIGDADLGADEPVSCPAQDIRASLADVQCTAVFTFWKWDGDACVPVDFGDDETGSSYLGCGVEGADRQSRYPDYFSCQAAHEEGNCCTATIEEQFGCGVHGFWDWDSCGCVYGQDCDGHYPDLHQFTGSHEGALLGDGTCHDGTGNSSLNFNCLEWNFDEGDCDLPCGWELNNQGLPERYACDMGGYPWECSDEGNFICIWD